MTLRNCALCGTEFDGKTSSKLCPSCRIYTTSCEFCGKTFFKRVSLSQVQKHGYPRFCSPSCRNKARRLAKVPCPICGRLFMPRVVDVGGVRKKYCSPRCQYKARSLQPSPLRTPQHIKKEVRRRYPTEGADSLALEFSLTPGAIQQIAYKQDIKLGPGVYRERVHAAAREYMSSSNPMKKPESVAKVAAYWKAHPEKVLARREKHTQALQKMQRDKPSGLERKLWTILDSLGVQYKTQVIIKPKFVVDVTVGSMIIQADGDYWHGHPRFEPLTARQKRQQARDRAQDAYLLTCGYTVCRIWESDMSISTVSSLLEKHADIVNRTANSLENGPA